MPGTEPARLQASDLIHRLTTIGWLFIGGEFGFILFQTERARSVDGTRFATAWDQRIEVLSFLVLPPNIVALAPAATIAAIATYLAGAKRSVWLDALLRSVAAIAFMLAAVGAAAVTEVATRAGETDLDAVFLRLGGISIALGMAWLCRTVDELRPDQPRQVRPVEGT